MNWLDFQRYAVFGLGRSGIAAANLLARRDKDVLASDTRDGESLEATRDKLDDSVEVHGGGNVLGDAEVVVVSPGLRPSLEVFEEATQRDVPVISEIELAGAASRSPMVAITGTDGKSTTTVLTEHLLDECGVEAVAGGNLGTPLCDLVDDVSEQTCIVAEVSAFQLWTTHAFQPRAIGFTNISYDHLDYFETYREYVAAKKRLMRNADEETSGVFNAGDEWLRTWAAEFVGQPLLYGPSRPSVEGYDDALWLEEGRLMARFAGGADVCWLEDVSELPFLGAHNLLNLMCAAGLAIDCGAELSALGEAATSFEPLPHRLEYCGKVGDVAFFDDSKATNVNAAVAGMESLDGRLVPIVGGLDKDLDLDDLLAELGKRAEHVVVIGAISERLTGELEADGFAASRIHTAGSMDEAVRRAHELAQASLATVVLSPACSSFDMYESYAERGEVFQQAVDRLAP